MFVIERISVRWIEIRIYNEANDVHGNKYNNIFFIEITHLKWRDR